MRSKRFVSAVLGLFRLVDLSITLLTSTPEAFSIVQTPGSEARIQKSKALEET